MHVSQRWEQVFLTYGHTFNNRNFGFGDFLYFQTNFEEGTKEI